LAGLATGLPHYQRQTTTLVLCDATGFCPRSERPRSERPRSERAPCAWQAVRRLSLNEENCMVEWISTWIELQRSKGVEVGVSTVGALYDFGYWLEREAAQPALAPAEKVEQKKMRCIECGDFHDGDCDETARNAFVMDCCLDEIDAYLDIQPEPGSRRWMIDRGEYPPGAYPAYLKKNITFKDGCMWEGGDWEISLNHECSENGGGVPCKHCYGEEVKHRVSAYNSGYTEKIWICPSLVIAKNEGDCNSTGVCLQCILEAGEALSHLADGFSGRKRG